MRDRFQRAPDFVFRQMSPALDGTQPSALQVSHPQNRGAAQEEEEIRFPSKVGMPLFRNG